jgi:hypothetical protein
MVLSNASSAARKQQLIINRANCGGSSKKSGLAPRVGWFLSSNPRLIGAPQTQIFSKSCIGSFAGNFTNPSQSAWRAIRRY